MRCAQCVEIIITAKERQEKEANKHADSLLKLIDEERNTKLRVAKKREKKKEKAREKRKEAKESKKKTTPAESVDNLSQNGTSKSFDDDDDKENFSNQTESPDSVITATVIDDSSSSTSTATSEKSKIPTPVIRESTEKSDPVSKTSPVSSSEKRKPKKNRKDRNAKDEIKPTESEKPSHIPAPSADVSPDVSVEKFDPAELALRQMMIPVSEPTHTQPPPAPTTKKSEKDSKQRNKQRKSVTREFVNSEIAAVEGQQKKKEIPQGQEGNWDVVKLKKPVRRLTLPSNLIARVIGRSGCNVNAIRDVTQTHIDIEKPKKGGGDRTITIRGNNESTTLAYTLMEELINHPEKEIEDIIDHHLPNESKARKEKPDQALFIL